MRMHRKEEAPPVIISLRDGFRLIKHRHDKNYRLVSADGSALGTVRVDAAAAFQEAFNNQPKEALPQ